MEHQINTVALHITNSCSHSCPMCYATCQEAVSKEGDIGKLKEISRIFKDIGTKEIILVGFPERWVLFNQLLNGKAVVDGYGFTGSEAFRKGVFKPCVSACGPCHRACDVRNRSVIFKICNIRKSAHRSSGQIGFTARRACSPEGGVGKFYAAYSPCCAYGGYCNRVIYLFQRTAVRRGFNYFQIGRLSGDGYGDCFI